MRVSILEIKTFESQSQLSRSRLLEVCLNFETKTSWNRPLDVEMEADSLTDLWATAPSPNPYPVLSYSSMFCLSSKSNPLLSQPSKTTENSSLTDLSFAPLSPSFPPLSPSFLPLSPSFPPLSPRFPLPSCFFFVQAFTSMLFYII